MGSKPGSVGSGYAGPGSAGREAERPAPGLYLVATPIGNLGDITLRALALLKAADLIVCEDTRVARKLLSAYGLSGRLIAYNDHNAAKSRPRILESLARGEVVALTSDAGTPLVSDPGYRLIQEALAADCPVTALPGASAVLTALVLSGLPAERFFFVGFLPSKRAKRRSAVAELAAIPGALVIFEAARRLAPLLADLAEVLGPRPAVVARELTKLHEELRRGDLTTLAAHYGAAGPPKGEVVVVVAPPPAPAETPESDAGAADALLGAALARLPLREAVALAVEAGAGPRRVLYRRALALKSAREAADDGRED
jgi:16S rRNA (cytidine1402-2'-O)-methyltransferase